MVDVVPFRLISSRWSVGRVMAHGTGNRLAQLGKGDRATHHGTGNRSNGNRLTEDSTELRIHYLLLFLWRESIIAVRVLCWDNFLCLPDITISLIYIGIPSDVSGCFLIGFT